MDGGWIHVTDGGEDGEKSRDSATEEWMGSIAQRFDEWICNVVEKEMDAIWGASRTARRGASGEIT